MAAASLSSLKTILSSKLSWTDTVNVFFNGRARSTFLASPSFLFVNAFPETMINSIIRGQINRFADLNRSLQKSHKWHIYLKITILTDMDSFRYNIPFSQVLIVHYTWKKGMIRYKRQPVIIRRAVCSLVQGILLLLFKYAYVDAT